VPGDDLLRGGVHFLPQAQIWRGRAGRSRMGVLALMLGQRQKIRVPNVAALAAASLMGRPR